MTFVPKESAKSERGVRKMSGLSLVGRLVARQSSRSSSCTLTTRKWRFYSPKGSQLPVVEEKRRRAMEGGGEKRLEKQHKSVR